ncbi:MAG: alpha-ribazole phosphatase [Eubacteriales bacterium]
MSCRIYFIRHGQTNWNAEFKFQGHTDVPLSGIGIEQAEFLARRLRDYKITAFYASDLTRAVKTAEILAQPHNLPVMHVPELREVNFGNWEGKVFTQEVKNKLIESGKNWWDSPFDNSSSKGESFSQMSERVNEAIRSIVERHLDDQEIVVVSHGGVIRAVVAVLLGMDLVHYWRLRLDNACLNIIDFNSPDWGTLVLFNDLSHLSCS